MFLTHFICAASALAIVATAASFPPASINVKQVNSTRFPGVSISYKETYICETTANVRAYSGYVHLPPNVAEHRNYTSNIFFWFFEARECPEGAPLAVWIQGGPGVPSISAAVSENGPCTVLEDSHTTELNPWSWNEKVNMLYIDQPTQVGFSYDSLVNGTLDEIDSPFDYRPFNATAPVPQTNLTFLTGTFSSKNPNSAPNTTIASSLPIYHFMQAWMQDFPEYESNRNSFSLWGESYAGHYNPTFASVFEQKAAAIEAGNSTGPDKPLHIDTVGLVDPCVDIDTQMPYYPQFAMNNTYGFKAISDANWSFALESLQQCRVLTAQCKKTADEKDPLGLGNVAEVNAACYGAYHFCFTTIHDNYTSTRNVFDIAAPGLPEAFPPKWAAGYFNQAEVQQALGVPLNFTGASALVAASFVKTGDFVRGHQLQQLGSLLDSGVKVAFMFGDRDYQCNWLGGEALSLAIQSRSTARFAAAGYADLQTNASYVGGLVRQYGNLSFARVFQAGHEAPNYQPETTLEIFNRVMFDKDVATGTEDLRRRHGHGHGKAGVYATKGPSSAWTKSTLVLETEVAKCYVWDIMETCTADQAAALKNGTAVTENFVLVGVKGVNGSVRAL